jgi:hypothetical protein
MLQQDNSKELTQSQLSLWVGQKLNPTSPIYNMAHSFELKGRIDIECFQRAFNNLIKNVDVLRTVFKELKGVPSQTVLEDYDYFLEVLDFSLKTKEEIQAYMIQRSQVCFDFSRPPFDSFLIKVGEEKYIWFLNVHHIITDATSSTLFHDYLSKYYAHQIDEGTHHQLNVPHYSDYIKFEREARERDINKELKEYWTSKLDFLKFPVHLYGEKNNNNDTRSERISLKLGSEISQAIRKLAVQKEIRQWTLDLTLFNLFLTSFFIYLNKVSGQTKLAIGAPIHNRTKEKFKRTPGLFIEVFPILGQIQA